MLSRAVYAFCVVVMCYASFFFYPKWKKENTEATISWDVSGYYWYLPSVFIYKDLKHQGFKDTVLNKYRPTNTDFQQAMQVDNGNYVMKYSSGMAVMYLPFFAVAHVLAKPLGYPADGFSRPYQLAIQLGGFLMSILGLWYLRKLLLLYYEDKVVAVTIAILVPGTNYLNYAAIDCGMSHCWLFTIYVFILLNTHYFYASFRLKYAVRIGLLVGLATLTRPTDVISCLIPLLWGMENLRLSTIKNRIALIADRYKQLLAAGACAMLVVAMQPVYWKYASGHWVVYSYAGQGFSWKHPHSILYAFNYRSGWLTYAPMMLLAFAGIIPFLKYGRNKIAILCFFMLNYYIVSAWDIWWYGGRAMVQSYPVLLFTVAALVRLALSKKILTWAFAPAVLLFTYFNVWLTVQSHGGGLYDSETMTKSYFWRVAGRWSAPENTIFLRDDTQLYEPQPKDLNIIYKNNFSNDTGALYIKNSHNGTTSLLLNRQQPLSPVYSFAYTGTGAKWIRVKATFHCSSKEWSVYNMVRFITRLTDKSKPLHERTVKENMIRPNRLLYDGETKTLSLDMELPAKHYDSVSILAKNTDSDHEIEISDLKVYEFSH